MHISLCVWVCGCVCVFVCVRVPLVRVSVHQTLNLKLKRMSPESARAPVGLGGASLASWLSKTVCIGFRQGLGLRVQDLGFMA